MQFFIIYSRSTSEALQGFSLTRGRRLCWHLRLYLLRGEEAGQEVLAELVAELDRWEWGEEGGQEVLAELDQWEKQGLGEEAGQEVIAELVAEVDRQEEGGGEVGDRGEEGVGLVVEPERLHDVESESVPELPELDIRVGGRG